MPPPPRCSAAATCMSSPASRASTASARPTTTRMMVRLHGGGDDRPREQILEKLVDIQYARNDVGFEREVPCPRRRVEVLPAIRGVGYRIELFGDEVERSRPSTRSPARCSRSSRRCVYPATHFVTARGADGAGRRGDRRRAATSGSRARGRGQAARGPAAAARTAYDMEMLLRDRLLPRDRELLPAPLGRAPGEPPNTLLDFFPDDYPAVDRRVARQTVPQIARHVRRRPRRKRRSSSTASACLRRSTTARCGSTSGRSAGPADLRLGHAGRLRARMSAARSSSRSSARPA